MDRECKFIGFTSSKLTLNVPSEQHQNIYPLSTSLTTSGANAYLGIVPSPEGYNHIALFSPANSGSPRFLTAGQWEVTSGIKGVDMEKGLM